MQASRHQNAGQNHNIKTANKSFENMVKTKKFGNESKISEFDS
jgi:hypothetical protein